MLGVGEQFPSFSLTATVSTEKGKTFRTITDTDFSGKWKVFFFWPKDFTFVCPTEISAFGALDKEFKARDAQLLGGSIGLRIRPPRLAPKSPRPEESPVPDAGRHPPRPVRHVGNPRRPQGRCSTARDLHRRPAEYHPLRIGERSLGRPQSAGSASRSGRPADRRSHALQLASRASRPTTVRLAVRLHRSDPGAPLRGL